MYDSFYYCHHYQKPFATKKDVKGVEKEDKKMVEGKKVVCMMCNIRKR
jgi:hypothetical protein